MSYYMNEQLEAGEYYDMSRELDYMPMIEIEVDEEGGVWVVATDVANSHEERLGREITREDLDRALHILNSELTDDEKANHPVSVDFAYNSMKYGEGDRFLEWTFPAGHADKMGTTDNVLNECWGVLAQLGNVTDPGTFGTPYAFPGDDD